MWFGDNFYLHVHNGGLKLDMKLLTFTDFFLGELDSLGWTGSDICNFIFYIGTDALIYFLSKMDF